MNRSNFRGEKNYLLNHHKFEGFFFQEAVGMLNKFTKTRFIIAPFSAVTPACSYSFISASLFFLSQSSSSLGPHISLISPCSCSRGLKRSISISLGSCPGTLAILFPRICGSVSDRGGGRITVLAAA